MFFLNILNLNERIDYYPKTLEFNNHFMLHMIPEESRSQNIKNLGIMKPSMWMICHRSSSGQFHILVVTRMLIIGEPDKMLIDLRNRKEADSYLLFEWRVWSVV
jgi:hypothetical protein